jgi:hypothetical protein
VTSPLPTARRCPEIYAITVIATLAGAIGSFLQKRGLEIDEKR